MKNNFKKLFLFLAVASLASSCDLGSEDEPNFGNGPFVAQFPYAESTGFFLKDDAVVYPYDVPVELVGGNGLAVNQDITLSYEVDTELSTAVEGVNFDFANATNTAVIPAGSTFSTIPITVYSGTLDDQNPPVLVLTLTEVSADGINVIPSGTKKTIALTLQGTCNSDLAGAYSNVTLRIDPAGGPYSWAVDQIDEVAPGTYNTSYVGQYYAPGNDVGTGATSVLPAATDAGYTFKEVCGRIKVETQNLASVYTNEIRQSDAQYAASSVNHETGVIVIQYSIFFTNNTVERKYESTYTPM